MVTLPRQRGVVAAKLETLRHGDNQHKTGDANLHVLTRADAADMLNVSTRTVASAQKVISEAPQEVVQAVERGAMSVSLAAKVAALPDAAPARPFVFLPAIAPDANQLRQHRSVIVGVSNRLIPLCHWENVGSGVSLSFGYCVGNCEPIGQQKAPMKGLVRAWFIRISNAVINAAPAHACNAPPPHHPR